MIPTLTATQAKTLRTLIAMGGEVNFLAGVKGLDSRCEQSLIDNLLVIHLGTCACDSGQPCDRTHRDLTCHRNAYANTTCYRRTRITTTGRLALAIHDGDTETAAAITASLNA